MVAEARERAEAVIEIDTRAEPGGSATSCPRCGGGEPGLARYRLALVHEDHPGSAKGAWAPRRQPHKGQDHLKLATLRHLEYVAQAWLAE